MQKSTMSQMSLYIDHDEDDVLAYDAAAADDASESRRQRRRSNGGSSPKASKGKSGDKGGGDDDSGAELRPIAETDLLGGDSESSRDIVPIYAEEIASNRYDDDDAAAANDKPSPSSKQKSKKKVMKRSTRFVATQCYALLALINRQWCLAIRSPQARKRRLAASALGAQRARRERVRDRVDQAPPQEHAPQRRHGQRLGRRTVFAGRSEQHGVNSGGVKCEIRMEIEARTRRTRPAHRATPTPVRMIGGGQCQWQANRQPACGNRGHSRAPGQ